MTSGLDSRHERLQRLLPHEYDHALLHRIYSNIQDHDQYYNQLWFRHSDTERKPARFVVCAFSVYAPHGEHHRPCVMEYFDGTSYSSYVFTRNARKDVQFFLQTVLTKSNIKQNIIVPDGQDFYLFPLWMLIAKPLERMGYMVRLVGDASKPLEIIISKGELYWFISDMNYCTGMNGEQVCMTFRSHQQRPAYGKELLTEWYETATGLQTALTAAGNYRMQPSLTRTAEQIYSRCVPKGRYTKPCPNDIDSALRNCGGMVGGWQYFAAARGPMHYIDRRKAYRYESAQDIPVAFSWQQHLEGEEDFEGLAFYDVKGVPPLAVPHAHYRLHDGSLVYDHWEGGETIMLLWSVEAQALRRWGLTLNQRWGWATQSTFRFSGLDDELNNILAQDETNTALKSLTKSIPVRFVGAMARPRSREVLVESEIADGLHLRPAYGPNMVPIEGYCVAKEFVDTTMVRPHMASYIWASHRATMYDTVADILAKGGVIIRIHTDGIHFYLPQATYDTGDTGAIGDYEYEGFDANARSLDNGGIHFAGTDKGNIVDARYRAHTRVETAIQRRINKGVLEGMPSSDIAALHRLRTQNWLYDLNTPTYVTDEEALQEQIRGRRWAS